MQLDPLLALIALPIIAGCICLPITDRFKLLARAFSVIPLACLGGTIYVFMKKPLSWQFGSSTIFIADNTASFIAVGVAFFALLIAVYSSSFIERSCGKYYGYLLMTLGGSLGAVYANDLIAMVVFWGFLAAMLYLMVSVDGTEKAAAAAKKALIIIGATDALLIFGIGLAWAATGTLAMDRMHIPLSGASAYVAYFSIAIAAFAKAGAMPFHSWLPDVAEDAPAPVTAYLPASLDKLLGIYLLFRASTTLFVMNNISNTVLLIVGSVTIVLAVVIALVQHNLKRLLGYHAISQVGYMVLGIGTGNPIGIAGGLFHMLNHAVYKSCLFLAGGAVEKKAKTADLDSLGGLAKFMPLTFACFLIASLSISGIPPFNGFVSKWMVYQGIIESASAKNPGWIVWLSCAMFGSALTIASFMKLLHSVFLGRKSDGIKDIKEAGIAMALPMAALAVICFIFGVLAFKLPLPLFILPSIGASVAYIGSWSPVLATALIAAGIILGLLVYALTGSKSYRTVGSFVGGEDPEKMPRVSGTEFYDTIKELKGFAGIYKEVDKGGLDLYNLIRKPVYFFTRILQFLHNGVLPTYLIWCFLGMIAMFVVLFLR
jgi:formate hydrogenlyase subunit 3/multisubunit Na+/H+ antiporter MnhD subunit